ncbi:MAG: twin-arginine translocase TatA/TatE family subunit [Prevotellaceae bacterium]|jgi:sec-independent protein translocase protein TatA|nr:twin-arginine translocase TatA/TatE family subunit [Prevotellaceae bacterium]
MKTFLFLSPPIIVLIVVVVILLFGGKKLPELMKGLGQGIKGFKDEMKDDDKKIEK